MDDEMEVFDHDGWQFLCSGEQLSLGVHQAVVRCRFGPDRVIRTLLWGSELHPSGWQALMRAKELAVEWTLKHRRSDYEFI